MKPFTTAAQSMDSLSEHSWDEVASKAARTEPPSSMGDSSKGPDAASDHWEASTATRNAWRSARGIAVVDSRVELWDSRALSAVAAKALVLKQATALAWWEQIQPA